MQCERSRDRTRIDGGVTSRRYHHNNSAQPVKETSRFTRIIMRIYAHTLRVRVMGRFRFAFCSLGFSFIASGLGLGCRDWGGGAWWLQLRVVWLCVCTDVDM